MKKNVMLILIAAVIFAAPVFADDALQYKKDLDLDGKMETVAVKTL